MIGRAEALRYLGVHGEPDERLTALLDECETELLAAARPRFVWRIFDIVRSGSEISLSGCDFSLIGGDIARHLEGCTKAAVTAATLSADADRLLKRLQLSDSAKAVAADALASVLAEQTSEQARQALLNEMTGYSATWCYAAGYGDFPLEQAAQLLTAVDASRKIGVTVTTSNMMTPQKSIVGIVGLSETPLNSRRRSCEDCNLKDACLFRKNGTKCNM
ncbi:MAG: methionine synthase [Ruminococcaceae bacterium]|nr:methionine synthase [Oscillospiraceae bacterium]